MARTVLWQGTSAGRLTTEVAGDTQRVICYQEEGAAPEARVTDGLQVLYGFDEGIGTTIHDVSGVGTAFDLAAESEAAVRWEPDGWLVVPSPTVISSAGAASSLIQAAKASNEITLEAWIKPASATQDGPARIITLSADANNQNFHLAQTGPQVEVRLRTTQTTLNGRPALSTLPGSVAADLMHVVYTRDASGGIRIYIDGVVVADGLVGGDLSNWDEGYRLALANELAGGRAWLGEYHLVAVYDRALSAAEVSQNFVAREGAVPEPPLPEPLPDSPPPEPPTPSGPTYYVARQGNDSNDGSYGSPWRTIGYACRRAVAGDVIYIQAGTYNEQLIPQNSGTAGHYITFAAHNDAEVVIQGVSTEKQIVNISSKSYIRLIGLTIRHKSGDIWQEKYGLLEVNGSTAGYNEIYNCTITRDRDLKLMYTRGEQERGIAISGAHHTLVQGCTIRGVQFGVLLTGGQTYARVRYNHITNLVAGPVRVGSRGKFQRNIIEYNILEGSLTDDGFQCEGNSSIPVESRTNDNQGHIIRRNIIRNNGENAIDLKFTRYIVVEDNIIYGTIGSGDGPMQGGWNWQGGTIIKGTDTGSRDVIIRRNLLIDNFAGIRVYDYWYVYHNTLVGNNRDFEGPNSTYTSSRKPPFFGAHHLEGRVVIKNNIMAGHNTCEVAVRSNVGSCYVNSNLYYNSKGARFVDFLANSNWRTRTFGEWKSYLAGKSNITGKDADSMEQAPSFANGPERPVTDVAAGSDHTAFDYRLRPGSPAIDAAEPLTRCRGSGSGTAVQVDDANYFFDGWGVTAGDMVKIGSNPAVEVKNVDYGTKRLTLATSIAWSDNDPVYLNEYHGSAPDIGAYEYG
ncbi:LamG-like jellyroll fold domain-containing protein [Chloroflexota bacterium]